jgi:hypothetical protein
MLEVFFCFLNKMNEKRLLKRNFFWKYLLINQYFFHINLVELLLIMKVQKELQNLPNLIIIPLLLIFYFLVEVFCNPNYFINVNNILPNESSSINYH